MPTAQQADPKVVETKEKKEVDYSFCSNEYLLISLESIYLRRREAYNPEFFEISRELHGRIDDADQI